MSMPSAFAAGIMMGDDQQDRRALEQASQHQQDALTSSKYMIGGGEIRR
jgi:hypothetical protein